MTKPSAADPTEQQMTARSPGRSLLVLIFRLLLLGVGGVTATLLGILAAQFFPAPPAAVDDPPLLERLLRQTGGAIDALRGLRSQARPQSMPLAAIQPVSMPPAPLPDAQRQQVQTELTQLQSDLAQLGDRTAALEAQLGQPPANAPLELRLQRLTQQLDPSAVPAPAAPSSEPLSVTLPSDALFPGRSPRLSPDSQRLLSSVMGELQRYPGAAIRIAAHTDAQPEASTARTRSFAQAEAIEQQLTAALGNGYHWVVVGYGQTRPVAANDTPPNRQRNRRIEIGIDPR